MYNASIHQHNTHKDTLEIIEVDVTEMNPEEAKKELLDYIDAHYELPQGHKAKAFIYQEEDNEVFSMEIEDEIIPDGAVVIRYEGTDYGNKLLSWDVFGIGGYVSELLPETEIRGVATQMYFDSVNDFVKNGLNGWTLKPYDLLQVFKDNFDDDDDEYYQFDAAQWATKNDLPITDIDDFVIKHRKAKEVAITKYVQKCLESKRNPLIMSRFLKEWKLPDSFRKHIKSGVRKNNGLPYEFPSSIDNQTLDEIISHYEIEL